MYCKFMTPCGLCELKSMSGLPYSCDKSCKEETPEKSRRISTEELLKPLNKRDGEG